jgi:hypothetical protein
MKPLTIAQVATLNRSGLHRVGGATGLYLQIGHTGGKSWVYRFRLNGARRLMGIGSADRVTLAEAREAARLTANRIDPIEARRDERAARAEAARPKPPRRPAPFGRW